MAAPTNLTWLAGRPASRRELRRLSRRFAAVGVLIPVARLAEIAAGLPARESELFDIEFAAAANRIQREGRRATRIGTRRRGVHWAIVLGGVVVALNLLLCLGLVFFVLAQHALPY